MVRKIISLRVPKGVDPYVLAEEVRKASRAQTTVIRVVSGRVHVVMYGDPVSLERSLESIRSVYKEVVFKHRALREAMYVRVPKDRVASVLGAPLKLDALKLLLRALGVSYKESQDFLEVGMGLGELLEASRRLHELYNAARDTFSEAACAVACVAAYLLDVDVPTVARIGESLGVFRRSDDKLQLTVQADEALRRLVSSEEERLEEMDNL